MIATIIISDLKYQTTTVDPATKDIQGLSKPRKAVSKTHHAFASRQINAFTWLWVKIKLWDSFQMLVKHSKTIHPLIVYTCLYHQFMMMMMMMMMRVMRVVYCFTNITKHVPTSVG